MSDARTLRLAHPDVSSKQVEAFIVYQRALLRALMEVSGDDWAGRFAFAHSKALKASGLETLEHRQISGAVQAFCGRASAAQVVRQKVAELETRKGQLTPREASVLDKAPEELRRLDDRADLVATLGETTLASLSARETELVELHRAVAAAEGHGHLHFKGQA